MDKRFSALITAMLTAGMFMAYPAFVHPQPSQKAVTTVLGNGASSATVTSGPVVIYNKDKKMVMSAPVHAVTDDLTLDCRQLELYYTINPEKDQGEKKQSDAGAFDKIEKAIISGDVRIARLDGTSAFAENVIYTKAEGKVIMTGNPAEVKGVSYLIQGSKIIYDLKEDSYSVEVSDPADSKAVVYPKDLKGKSIVPQQR